MLSDGAAREHLSVDALDDGDDITGNVHTTPTNHSSAYVPDIQIKPENSCKMFAERSLCNYVLCLTHFQIKPVLINYHFGALATIF